MRFNLASVGVGCELLTVRVIISGYRPVFFLTYSHYHCVHKTQGTMKNYVNLDIVFKKHAVVMHVVFDARHIVAKEGHAHLGAQSTVVELRPLDLRLVLRPLALYPTGIAPLRPAMCSTAARSVRICRAN